MEITFNNHTQQIQERSSIQIILNDLIGEKQKGIAVAVNETVVPKTQWDSYVLQTGDKVLVIKATQGG
ncbi:MAG: thiamine biosynthesis protein ThiS [Ferruginibacter sp.]|uniref:sulfur carrier protein ThiS n=1 Tax=Ferruginibacter sp. TaxID=1940288 RepID=UPI002659C676|nr:sulfur carrier protein ThiS [Ferruginibacter sp.]MDB5280662.1 thiamine biosynthesis protein ThiS [Ferruginibacter sp.]